MLGNNLITPALLSLLVGTGALRAKSERPAEPATTAAPPSMDLGEALRELRDELPASMLDHADVLTAFVSSGDASALDEREGETGFERFDRRVPYDVAREAFRAFAYPHNIGRVRDPSAPLTRAEKAAQVISLACCYRRSEVSTHDPLERARLRAVVERTVIDGARSLREVSK